MKASPCKPSILERKNGLVKELSSVWEMRNPRAKIEIKRGKIAWEKGGIIWGLCFLCKMDFLGHKLNNLLRKKWILPKIMILLAMITIYCCHSFYILCLRPKLPRDLEQLKRLFQMKCLAYLLICVVFSLFIWWVLSKHDFLNYYCSVWCSTLCSLVFISRRSVYDVQSINKSTMAPNPN